MIRGEILNLPHGKKPDPARIGAIYVRIGSEPTGKPSERPGNDANPGANESFPTENVSFPGGNGSNSSKIDSNRAMGGWIEVGI